jgi:mannose-6-phosphate isomerase
VLRGGADVERLVDAVVATAPRIPFLSSFTREWQTVTRVAELYPGDPGIVLTLLLNRISLKQGQVLALEAGTMHAYLEGLGIELMASSDNVLRGGLTKKHIDVEELLPVVAFEQRPIPIVVPERPLEGVTVWQPEGVDFLLAEVALGDAAAVHGYSTGGAERTAFDLSGPAIVLVLTGSLTIEGRAGSISLARGDAAYITPDERTLTFTGSGVAVVATTP